MGAAGMNREFLEFFGNFLVDVAKGQKRVEEILGWISGGFKDYEDLNEQFKKFYGLDRLSENDPEYGTAWRKSVEDFRKAFSEYLELFDVVSREKYDRVARECEELKEKVREQAQKIERLEAMLKSKGMEYASLAAEFQQMVEKQAREYRKVLESFTVPFDKPDSKKESG